MSDFLLIARPPHVEGELGLQEVSKELDDVEHRIAVADQAAPSSPSGFVVIGLRSQDCFAVPYAMTKNRRLPRGRVLAFDIEASLPSDADEIAVDALPNRDGWLVVAVERQICASVMDEVNAARGHVVAICPLAMVAWQAIRKKLPAGQRVAAVIASSYGTDAILVHDRQIEDWRWLGKDQKLLPALFEEWRGENPLECHAFGFGEDLRETLGEGQPLHLWSTSVDEAIESEAEAIATGRRTPVINLAEGPLASGDPLRPVSRSLTFALAGLLVLLLTSGFAMFWRARHYEQVAERHVNEQSQLFEETFPGEPIPVGIRIRFETEQRKLLGTRGSGSTSMPAVHSVVPVTHAWLSAMPVDVRYQLDRIELVSGKVALLSGIADSFSSLEEIAGSLRTAGFEVPPVSTSKTSNGVSIRLEDLTRRNSKE